MEEKRINTITSEWLLEIALYCLRSQNKTTNKHLYPGKERRKPCAKTAGKKLFVSNAKNKSVEKTKIAQQKVIIYKKMEQSV